MKKIIFLLPCFFIFLSACSSNTTFAKMVYYASDNCGHCAKVQEYMDANNILNKLSVEKKEVSKNQSNSLEFFDRAEKCGLVKDGAATIPLLWTGEQCVSGDVDIINFFKEKIKQ
ncbi:MAG: hypothetical protein PHT40_04595 [Patescibacteria group bacterium]|nr:hypothetical protein [Patescibacteria group bacterium]